MQSYAHLWKVNFIYIVITRVNFLITANEQVALFITGTRQYFAHTQLVREQSATVVLAQ